MLQLNRSVLGWSPFAGVILLLASSSFVQAGIVTRIVNATLNATNLDTYDLDVDLNGTNDFKFSAAFAPDPVLPVGFDVIDFPFGGNNGVVIDSFVGDGFPTVSRLSAGSVVSSANLFSSASFDQGNLFSFVALEPPTGNFEGQTGFIGLRFGRPEGIFYGFAQVSVNSRSSGTNPLGLTIGTVGYNDVVGQSAQITAVPEPTSLMMFGAGGLGILSTFFARSKRRTSIVPLHS